MPIYFVTIFSPSELWLCVCECKIHQDLIPWFKKKEKFLVYMLMFTDEVALFTLMNAC